MINSGNYIHNFTHSFFGKNFNPKRFNYGKKLYDFIYLAGNYGNSIEQAQIFPGIFISKLYTSINSITSH